MLRMTSDKIENYKMRSLYVFLVKTVRKKLSNISFAYIPKRKALK